MSDSSANTTPHSTNNLCCFLCNGRTAVSSRNTFDLFNDKQKTQVETNIAATLSAVLERPINEDTAHARFLCKKCKKLCLEYDELFRRANEIKYSIILSYNQTATQYGIPMIYIEDSKLEADEEKSVVAENIKIEKKENNVVTPNTLPVTLYSDPKPQEFFIQGKKLLLIKKTRLKPIKSDEFNKLLVIQSADDVQMEEIIQEPEIIEHDDNKEYFDSNDGNMVEISTENDTNFDNLIEEQTITDDNTISYPIVSYENIKKESDNYGSDSNVHIKTEPMVSNISDDITLKPIFIRDGGKFTCHLCPPNDKVYDVRTIAIHLKVEHEEKLYICDICGSDFRKRNELSEHLEEHVLNQQDGDFQCEVCQRLFSNLRLFRIHKRMHYTNQKSWTCEECNKKYSSKNLLDEHMNMHTGERPYKCQHCTKDFASKYTLTAHLKIHSERKRPFECKICQKSFFSLQNLTQHERTHTGVKEYICTVCDKAFGTLHNLDVHKIVHTGYKPFICRTCGKAFARRAEIKDHERTHTGERPYHCDICGSTFAQRSNLMSHKRATHLNDRRYKCEICSKCFKRRRLLEYHKKAMHTGERPYICEACGATFVYPEHYKKHLRIHTGVKPFKCEVCSKAFNSRDNRNAHRFVHSVKKPYECFFCGQGFMRRPLLLAHMEQQNHKNEVIITNHAQITNVPVRNENDDSDKLNDDDSNNILFLSDDNQLSVNEEGFIEEDIEEEGELTEEHLIIDGQVQFSDEHETDVELTGTEILGESDLSDVITSEHIFVTDETEFVESNDAHYIEMADGPVQSVQIRISNPDGKDNITWANLVSQ